MYKEVSLPVHNEFSVSSSATIARHHLGGRIRISFPDVPGLLLHALNWLLLHQEVLFFVQI